MCSLVVHKKGDNLSLHQDEWSTVLLERQREHDEIPSSLWTVITARVSQEQGREQEGGDAHDESR
jgi:hypothetical protein